MTSTGPGQPEVPKWQVEWDFPEVPENPTREELKTYITDIVARTRLREDSGHGEELVKKLREAAARHKAAGNDQKATEYFERADQISALEASNSAQADSLAARVQLDDE